MNAIRISFDGREYVFDGRQWYGADDYVLPPASVVPRLNAAVDTQLAAEDNAVQDPKELLARTQRACGLGQRQRALRLIRRAVEAKPKNASYTALLCGLLRETGQPADAVAAAEPFARSRESAVLTTRAAALCDLQRWAEALEQIEYLEGLAARAGKQPSADVVDVRERIEARARPAQKRKK